MFLCSLRGGIQAGWIVPSIAYNRTVRQLYGPQGRMKGVARSPAQLLARRNALRKPLPDSASGRRHRATDRTGSKDHTAANPGQDSAAERDLPRGPEPLAEARQSRHQTSPLAARLLPHGCENDRRLGLAVPGEGNHTGPHGEVLDAEFSVFHAPDAGGEKGRPNSA